MTEDLLSEIDAKLDTLIRIQALQSVRGMETQKDKIVFLYGAGIRPKDIASILGTTSNTVNVAMANHKKAQGKKAKGD
jgi:DNA-directed RNA polymerase specialized sigma24 family protein